MPVPNSPSAWLGLPPSALSGRRCFRTRDSDATSALCSSTGLPSRPGAHVSQTGLRSPQGNGSRRIGTLDWTEQGMASRRRHRTQYVTGNARLSCFHGEQSDAPNGTLLGVEREGPNSTGSTGVVRRRFDETQTKQVAFCRRAGRLQKVRIIGDVWGGEWFFCVASLPPFACQRGQVTLGNEVPRKALEGAQQKSCFKRLPLGARSESGNQNGAGRRGTIMLWYCVSSFLFLI